MTPPTIDCARALRNGGIDAMAALNEAVREAIVGLAPEQAQEVKHAIARVMGEVMDEMINPAVRAFPELKPDETAWVAIAKACAAARSNAA